MSVSCGSSRFHTEMSHDARQRAAANRCNGLPQPLSRKPAIMLKEDTHTEEGAGEGDVDGFVLVMRSI